MGLYHCFIEVCYSFQKWLTNVRHEAYVAEPVPAAERTAIRALGMEDSRDLAVDVITECERRYKRSIRYVSNVEDDLSMTIDNLCICM